MARRSTKPRDLNALAAAVVADATDERPAHPPEAEPLTKEELRLRAQEAGRKGGERGGKARADRLSPERRSEIARNAAHSRWASRGK